MDTNFEKSDILKAKKSTFKISHHMENTRYYFFTKRKRDKSESLAPKFCQKNLDSYCFKSYLIWTRNQLRHGHYWKRDINLEG